MKTDTVFKRAYNEALDLVAGTRRHGRCCLPRTAERRLGVSRIDGAQDPAGAGPSRTSCARAGAHRRREGGAECAASPRRKRFRLARMSSAVHGMDAARRCAARARPSTSWSLRRQFGVATSGIREFLNRFQRFGLSTSGRIPAGSSRASPSTSRWSCSRSARCSSCIRRGLRGAARRVRRWGTVSALSARSIPSCCDEIEARFHDFSELDSRFHRLINAADPNRFIDSFTTSSR